MTKKAMMLLLVAVGWVLRVKLGAPFDLDIAVAGFYCVTEGISILENAKELGLPVPPVLAERLKIEQKKVEKKANVS